MHVCGSEGSVLLTVVDKLVLEFMWKGKGTRMSKTVLKKRNKVGRLTVPCSLAKDRHIGQWSRRGP